jgi:outer membrane lipoprotein-sorting protein
MTRSRALSSALLLLALLLIWPAAAGADAKGERVLKLMDKSLNSYEDESFVYTVTTKEPGKAKRVMNIKVAIKGEARRVDFMAPGDVKGMKVLILSLDQMYIYLPAYRKIRRVASHVRDQGFMGTTFSHDDMSITRYGPHFTATLEKETRETWTIKTTRKAGSKYGYKMLRFVVNKKGHYPLEIRYYNNKGAHAKTETRSGYVCDKGICLPKLMHLVDHTRNDAWSEFATTEWKVNSGVSKRFFTQRALQRRR